MTLTQLTPQQKAHSQNLTRHISQAIQDNNGWIGFDEFMNMALYAPGLGYYAAGTAKLGEAGDFITAPMMGDLFGQCLSGQIHEVLSQVKQGAILEFGAGNGVLAATILKQLAVDKSLPEKYYILEISPDLRARQQQTIKDMAPQFLGCIEWLDVFPDSFCGVMLANEVIDAMPVKVFEQQSLGEINELGVGVDQKGVSSETFCWQSKLAGDSLHQTVKGLNLQFDTPVYRSEINFQAQAWVKSVAKTLHQGAIFIIDYGFDHLTYYHPDRLQGTLMCHFRHTSHDQPFCNIGLQDITAHVDFSALARSAKSSNLDIMGFATQGSFLLSAGLLDIIDLGATTQKQFELTQQIKKLTLPHEMGELFKVLVFSKGVNQQLSGFKQQNNDYRL